MRYEHGGVTDLSTTGSIRVPSNEGMNLSRR
jgi:hypothetical protein